MDIEKIILGTALSDPSTLEEISKLKPSDFSGVNQDLFSVIKALYDEESLSYRAVTQSLYDEGLLPLIGDTETEGEDYLRQLIKMADSQGIRHHVGMIENRSVRNSLREVAALIAAEANDDRRSIQEIMDEAERRIFTLRRRKRDEEGQTMGDIIKAYLPFVDGLRSGEIQPAWIPPLKAVQEIVQYVDRTDFVILAGRPGDGKSSLLRYLALVTARGDTEFNQEPMKVVTFNLENDPFEYAKFAIATISGINSAKLKEPRTLSEHDYERFLASAQTLVNLPWDIVTLSRPKAIDVDRIARKKVAEGAQLLQLDYLQLISNRYNRRHEDLAETTGTLRGITLKTNIPMIAACQLNRAIDYRGEAAEPQLSDLRESGTIEQDATQVWFIRSLWHRDPTPEEVSDPQFRFEENFVDGPHGPMHRNIVQAVPIRIWIKKNRNGPIGHTDPIKWVRSTGQFRSFVRSVPF